MGTVSTDGTIAPVYVVVEGEVHINSSVEETWPHVLNYTSWQDYSVSEHVSGSVGGDGEVVLLTKVEEGFTFPPYYGRTILLEPLKRVIWKTYPQQPGPGNDWFGFVDFAVAPVPDGTHFTYKFLYELNVPYESDEALQRYKSEMIAATEAANIIIMGKLKALAESAGDILSAVASPR